MVQFDDLRISSDKQKLYVECRVKDYDAYQNMYIKSIKLEYYKKRGPVGVPGASAITMYSNPSDTSIKQVRATLNVTSLTETFGTDKFEGGLFYVTVECDGTLGASAAQLPCGEDSTIDIGLVLDWEKLYAQGMAGINSMLRGCNPCEVPGNFEHFLLVWNGLKLAMDACDYDLVDKLWGKLSFGAGDAVTISGCGCR